MLTVQDMMTKDPLTLSRYNSLHDAREMMQKNQFRHIPIVDEYKQLIGLVTQRNVLSHGLSSQDFIDSEELKKVETGTLLADIMTSDLTTVTQDTNLEIAAQLIYKKKFGCLPVVDENYHLKGIITDHDFVAITIQLMDMMNSLEDKEDL